MSRTFRFFVGLFVFLMDPRLFLRTRRLLRNGARQGSPLGMPSGVEQNGGGFAKIVEGYKQIASKIEKIAGGYAKSSRTPFQTKKMEVILYEPLTYTGLTVFFAKLNLVTC